MNFNKHYDLEGRHAFLSPSKYYWIKYDNDKLIDAYRNHMAAQKGTELHEFAKRCIELGIKLPNSKKTLNMYVNDAIGYKMIPEQPLFYSENCFGTADTISFKKDFLRIHDYKSGVIPAHIEQLMIYEAIFCLEYDISPFNIGSELRIYQSDDIITKTPEPEEIKSIMDTIILFDKRIFLMQEEGV